MGYCKWCQKNVNIVSGAGSTFCEECGRVFQDQMFSEENTFVRCTNGSSQLAGNYVKSLQSSIWKSRERLREDVQWDLRHMKDKLQMGDCSDDLITAAVNLYMMAVETKFTRGRKREYVEAACFYIVCRTRNRPYLLIDFANCLRTNVYEIGAVFLQLCQNLYLFEHDIVQKPVDPSLFIYKYTYGLCGKNKEVEETALQIIASMKRDWMQTGRKPSGLCGAAIYIAALSHGLKYSKTDVVRIVHICEATLTKRLIEFENTESGSLTIEEFMVKAKAKELEESHKSKCTGIKPNKTSSDEVVCIHKDSKLFACRLCEVCYTELMEFSGGFEGGSDPPAFQRAERERKFNLSGSDEHEDLQGIPSIGENENLSYGKDTMNGAADKLRGLDEDEVAEPSKTDDPTLEPREESCNFSDIDDVEVDGYLLSEKEKQYRKIIWEEMNREFLQEQAVKEAAAAAAQEAFAANFQNCPEDLPAAQKIAAAAAAAAEKSKKERQQKRAAEARNFVPPKSAAEAMRQMLTKKRLSSKINFDVLEGMFDETVASEKPSKKLCSENEESGFEKKALKSDDYEQEKIENECPDHQNNGDAYDQDAYCGDPYADYDYEDDGYGHDLY